MNNYIIENEGKKDYKFEGEHIAYVRTYPDTNYNDLYSGSNTSWQELTLYITNKKNYIGVKDECSLYIADKTKRDTAILKTEEDIIEFFGQDYLAHQLYKEADIDNMEEV